MPSVFHRSECNRKTTETAIMLTQQAVATLTAAGGKTAAVTATAVTD